MKHFLTLSLFALLVSVVFGITARDGTRAQALYGLSVWAKFIGTALVLAWVFYFLPM